MVVSNMGINLNVLTLKKNLIDAINGSGLPISVISYVVKDVLHEVQVEEQKIIQNEIQETNNAPQQTEEC